MWVFRRHVWAALDVRAPGMAFSQEIKNAAVRAKYRVLEVPIEYRMRGGEVKLKAIADGLSNLCSLVEHWLRRPAPMDATAVPGPLGAAIPLQTNPGTSECVLTATTEN
jgi:hypothetical protein